MKKKYNSKTIRISLGDYALLSEISRQGDLTMAEALHKLISGLDHKEPVHPSQLLMPVTGARSMPVTSTRQRSMPITKVRSTPITISFSRKVATNGHR